MGLQLRLIDELLARCPDNAALPLYFSIWFGNKPFNKRLRDKLLAPATE